MSTQPSSAMLNRSAALASIAVAIVLVSLKAWAAWTSGSTAMLGSLADTVLDLVASIATLVGVWVAAQPDDAKHRFGHGKAEALAAMFQVVLISISALALAAELGVPIPTIAAAVDARSLSAARPLRLTAPGTPCSRTT